MGRCSMFFWLTKEINSFLSFIMSHMLLLLFEIKLNIFYFIPNFSKKSFLSFLCIPPTHQLASSQVPSTMPRTYKKQDKHSKSIQAIDQLLKTYGSEEQLAAGFNEFLNKKDDQYREYYNAFKRLSYHRKIVGHAENAS